MRLLLPLLLITAAPLLQAQTYNALISYDRYCFSAAGSVTTGTCGTEDNQFRAVYNSSRNAFTLRTPSGNCLDGYRGKGQPLAVVGCDGTTEQDWWLHSSGQLQNQKAFNGARYCADIAGGLGSGRNVVLWDCHSGTNQKFAFGVIQSSRIPSGATTAPPPTRIQWLSNGQGAQLIAPGGGNLISAGGGNLISTGGLN